MSSIQENPVQTGTVTPEEHIAEVDEMLEEVERRIETTDNAPFSVEYEKTSPYKQENDWEEETAMTRGATSIKTDEELSKPEQHALGAQRIFEEYGIEASSVANIQLDGIGEKAAISSEYSIDVTFEEGKGVQYELERQNVNARDLDEQPTTENDLDYIESQIEGVLQQYNGPSAETQPGWNYGTHTVEALDD